MIRIVATLFRALLQAASRFLAMLGRLSVPVQLALPLFCFAALVALTGWVATQTLQALLLDDVKLLLVFRRDGIERLILNSTALSPFVALIYVGLGLLTFVRRSTILWVVRQAYLSVFTTLTFYAFIVVRTVTMLGQSESAVDGIVPTADWQFAWYCKYLIPAFVLLLLYSRFLLNTFRGHTEFLYRRRAVEAVSPGDIVIRWLNGELQTRRTRGVGLSLALHFGVLILPILLQLLGAVTPYRLPLGKGSPDAGGGAKQLAKGDKQEKRVIKVKMNAMKKPVKTMRNMKGVIFSPDAGKTVASTARTEAMMEEIDKLTELTYKADQNVVVGGTGTGTGGGTGPGNKAGGIGKGGVGPGGWPDGMKNSLIRFIRLEYAGAEWDDGMSAQDNADGNFLAEFGKITGFRVAQRGESHSPRLLAKYDKGSAPPFVYFTGGAGINLTATDIKCIRDYMMDGGMLFADAGSPEWDRNFRALIPTLLPGKSLVEISDDDAIFQAPYVFPNGAPPMWHHGGNRAMGVRHNGRWIVFYFPGDMNDAWKNGRSGLSPEKAKAAYDLGVNILYYSFTHYLEITAKQRR